MKIHVEGDIYITSDERQFMISKLQRYKDKEGNEKEQMVAQGYYTSLESLINGLVKRKLLQSNATTLNELLGSLKSIREEIGQLKIS
jgi:hypothetical protein